MPRRLALALLLSAVAGPVTAQVTPGGDWTSYGRTAGGDRHSPLRQITPANVGRLSVAWKFATGENAPAFATKRETRFEATPLAIAGRLYLSTPLGRVFALDGDSGEVIWQYDANVPRSLNWGDFANRGVSYWSASASSQSGRCARRIFLATIDARLIALDADDGAVCEGFGEGGSIDLRKGLRNPPFETEEYEETSPPLVVGDVVIVGSAVADNNRTNAASGEVRGFDARSGRLLWSWDPVPQLSSDPAYSTWVGPYAHRTGGANVWTVAVADPSRGLVFLPTTSPSPDYYGGARLGDNRYANSIVALEAKTGRLVWNFQTVHHDVWDYDNASPPALVTIKRHGKAIPALIQATKTGQLFVLDRRWGIPLFPVEERAVPRSDAVGEVTSATQPFNTQLPQLSPVEIGDRPWRTLSEPDQAFCAERAEGLRNDGPFTPPSERGSIIMPSNVGGVAWGGLSFDPSQHILVVPTNRVAAIVRLVPTEKVSVDADAEGDRVNFERTRMRGTPYTVERELFFSPSGYPCTAPPYGSLHAVNLETGKTQWNVPLGDFRDLPGAGGISFGGPVSTASGLTFIGAAMDGKFRAFQTSSGKLLWEAQLPGMGRSTPMTYRSRSGRQMVAIAAGRSTPGQEAALVVFALPTDEKGPRR